MTAHGQELELHRVERDGDRDLSFTGRIVGYGEFGTGGEFQKDWNRGTEVSIYITAVGRIITAVKQWTRWQGERDSHRAAVHQTPTAALNWLIRDAGGELGAASKIAWEDACENAPELAGFDVQHID